MAWACVNPCIAPPYTFTCQSAPAGRLLGERDHIGHGNVGIERPMTDEHFRRQCSRLGPLGGRETAVHADYRGKVGTGARERQRGHTAEAEPDRGEPSIDLGTRVEGGQTRGRALRQPIGCVAEAHERGHDALPIGCNPAAVHVTREHDVPEFGVSVSLTSSMVVQSGTTVDEEDAGAPIAPTLIEHDNTVERCAVVRVLQISRREGHGTSIDHVPVARCA